MHTAHVCYEFDECFQQCQLYISHACVGTRVDFTDTTSITTGLRITIGVEAPMPQVVATPMTYDEFCIAACVDHGETSVDMWPDFGYDMFISWKQFYTMFAKSKEDECNVELCECEDDSSQ